MAFFTKRAAKRVARQTVERERTPRNSPAGRNTRPPVVVPKRLALVGGSGIPTATWSSPNLTPGSGPGTLMVRTSTGWTTVGGQAVTLYNTAEGDDAEVAAGARVHVCWLDGRWVVDVDQCPAG